MNIPAQLKTKKLTSRQLLSIGFYIYKKTFNQIVLFLGLIYFPLTLIISLISYTLTNHFLERLSTDFSSSNLLLYWSFFLMINLIVLIMYALYYKTIVLLAYDYIHQKPFSYRVLSKDALHNLFSLWLLMLRLAINYVLRLLLLIVPGIIYLINNSSVIFAFLLRQERIKDAFTYNLIVMKGNAGRVFSLYLYPVIIYICFALLSNVLSLSVTDSSSTINNYSGYTVGLSLFSQIVFAVLVPGLINAHLCLFLNAESHKRLG
ncbi:MAG: hypothetical protein QNJ64_18195 [Crocosphaera sp.]|nr:hypothetical protein [Crocosphaera sp.]